MRSRLVALELFSPIPSLLSSRRLVSQLASQAGGRVGGERLLCIDVTKAFMYGLREATLIWQRVVRDTTTKLGFCARTPAQSVYYLPARRVTVVAHVDDFLWVESKEGIGEPTSATAMVGKLETRRGVSQRARSAGRAPRGDSRPSERVRI